MWAKFNNFLVRRMMDIIIASLQIIIALGLLNVWLLRYKKKTEYRGCGSCSLKEEFAAYGLPEWAFYLAGFIKVGGAIALLLGFWKPFLIFPAAVVISFMMLVAVLMHLKVGDNFKKFIPALTMLFLSLLLSYLTYPQI